MEEPIIFNILVVEDDENSFLYLMYALEARNFNVHRASNGIEAVELIEESQIQFDLVLMDLVLPLMDGFNATIEIKKMKANIPVIAQTGTYLYSETKRLVDSKIDAVLMKPFNISTLIDTILTVYKMKNLELAGTNRNSLLLLQ